MLTGKQNDTQFGEFFEIGIVSLYFQWGWNISNTAVEYITTLGFILQTLVDIPDFSVCIYFFADFRNTIIHHPVLGSDLD